MHRKVFKCKIVKNNDYNSFGGVKVTWKVVRAKINDVMIMNGIPVLYLNRARDITKVRNFLREKGFTKVETSSELKKKGYPNILIPLQYYNQIIEKTQLYRKLDVPEIPEKMERFFTNIPVSDFLNGIVSGYKSKKNLNLRKVYNRTYAMWYLDVLARNNIDYSGKLVDFAMRHVYIPEQVFLLASKSNNLKFAFLTQKNPLQPIPDGFHFTVQSYEGIELRFHKELSKFNTYKVWTPKSIEELLDADRKEILTFVTLTAEKIQVSLDIIDKSLEPVLVTRPQLIYSGAITPI